MQSIGVGRMESAQTRTFARRTHFRSGISPVTPDSKHQGYRNNLIATAASDAPYRLTFRFQGRDFRLTEVHGTPVRPVAA